MGHPDEVSLSKRLKKLAEMVNANFGEVEVQLRAQQGASVNLGKAMVELDKRQEALDQRIERLEKFSD